ncbi:MAG: hypothetical protein EXS33_00390 [Pedosphaera sp.]|nr:hypothetical protein [Pedosphaera sp.]
MRFLREHRFSAIFIVMLIFCSVMVIRQLGTNQSRRDEQHFELREALILLHSVGSTNEAKRIYQKLWPEASKLSNKVLLDDFQRTQVLVDSTARQPENPVWQYHWIVTKELELRSESTLVRARKLAAEK